MRYLVTANAAWRVDALRAVGGFDEQFPHAAGEDTDMSLRVVAAGARLGVTDRAVVLHDHRTTVSAMLRTYYRHGVSRQMLARRHPELRTVATAARVATWRYWRDRYRYYRTAGGTSPSVTVVYLALRAAGSSTFALGLVRSRLCGRAA